MNTLDHWEYSAEHHNASGSKVCSNVHDNYQKIVKAFSDMTLKNNHNPKVLFSIINSVLNGPSSIDLVPENDSAEKFASLSVSISLFFVCGIWSQISPDPWNLPTFNRNLASISQFQIIDISA